MQIQPFNHKQFLLVFLAVVWPQVHLTVHIKKVQVAAVLTLIEWMMDGIIRRRPIIWHIDATQGSCFDRLARDWWRQRRAKKWSELTSTRSSSFVQTHGYTRLNRGSRRCLLLVKMSERIFSISWEYQNIWYPIEVGWLQNTNAILVKGKCDERPKIIVGYQSHHKNLLNVPCYDLPI